MTARLLALATLLDALTTSLGLSLGLAERGPVASTLLPLLGPVYWPLQLAVLLLLYRLLARAGLPRGWASTLPALGPWAAGWSNLGMIAGVVA